MVRHPAYFSTQVLHKYQEMFFTTLTQEGYFSPYKPNARKSNIPKDLSLIVEKIYHSKRKRHLLLSDRLTHGLQCRPSPTCRDL